MAKVPVDIGVEVKGEGDLRNLNKGLKNATTRAGALDTKAGGLKGRLGGLAGAASGLAGGLGLGPAGLAAAAGAAAAVIGGKLFSGFLDVNDEIGKMSTRLGISTDTLQEWKFAAEQSGTSLNVVEKGYRRFAGVITDAEDGNATAIRTLDALGLSAEQLGKLSPEEQMRTLANAIQSVEDPAIRVALAEDAMGGAGTKLIPLLAGGAEGLDELGKQAHEASRVLDEETIRSSEEMNDTVNILKSSFNGIISNILSSFLPALLSVANFLKDTLVPFISNDVVPILKTIIETGFKLIVGYVKDFVIPTLRELFDVVFPIIKELWTGTIKPTIDSIISIFAGDGNSEGTSSLTGVLNTLKKVWNFVFGVVKEQVKLAVTFITNRIKLAIDILKGIISFVKSVFTGDWEGAWNAIKGIFNSIWEAIKGQVEAVIDYITGVFRLMGVNIKEVLVGVATTILNFFRDIALKAIDWIDTIVNIANKVPFVDIKFDAESMRDGINNAFDSATDAMDGWADSAEVARIDVTDEMRQAGEAIESKNQSAWNSAKTTASNASSDIVGSIGSVETATDDAKQAADEYISALNAMPRTIDIIINQTVRTHGDTSLMAASFDQKFGGDFETRFKGGGQSALPAHLRNISTDKPLAVTSEKTDKTIRGSTKKAADSTNETVKASTENERPSQQITQSKSCLA